MHTFKQFISLTEDKEGKNVHLTHVEDAVIYGGVEGTRFAIESIRGIRDTLSGSASKKYDVSIKFDGAPAVICGIDPSDGKFFVAKKGIFNKNPKVYKTPEDVKTDTSGDLAEKLLTALKELAPLGIKGIVQGDIMFTKSSVEKKTIDSAEYIVFQPNTIAYAVPADSELAKTVTKAELGIVFHTTYTGTSFDNLKASYGVDISRFKKTDRVWFQDAVVRDLSGKVSLTAEETKEVTGHLSKAGKLFNQIESGVLKAISTNKDLSIALETFYNSVIRKGSMIQDSRKQVEELILWIREKYQKEIDARKTEKGKAAQVTLRDEFLSFFSDKNKENLIRMFDLQKEIISAKAILIKKLNTLSSLNTFLQTDKGYKVTGDEGYVAIDHLSNKAVKLVDRLEFSFANFSPSVIKGWMKNK
jgi:Mg2+ and Co2+ transporter CorA